MTTIKRKMLMIFALGLILAPGAIAQLSLTGQYIPRTEYRHGFQTLPAQDQDAALFTAHRARLNFGYTHTDYRFGVSIQDIRVWGSTPQLNKSDGFLSVHEAWGEILFSPQLSLKAGRQELVYDDHRILGNVDWALQARSHDVALLKYADSTFMVHAGLAWNQEDERLFGHKYALGGNYKTMQFVWLHKDFKNIKGSFLLLNNGLQEIIKVNEKEFADLHFSQTMGPFLVYKKDKVKFTGFYYHQFGKDGSGRNLNAYDASLEINYSLTDNFNIIAGAEFLSGTSQTDTISEENRSFTPLFGTNHKFNGFMDYFYVGNHMNSVGLNDYYLKFKYKKDKLYGGIDLHFFSSAAEILNNEEFDSSGQLKAMENGLGQEVDLTLGYVISSSAKLQVGYSHLFPTGSMEILKGGDKDETSNWAYIMLKITPDFYKSENASSK